MVISMRSLHFRKAFLHASESSITDLAVYGFLGEVPFPPIYTFGSKNTN
jgi:hypothetical protein